MEAPAHCSKTICPNYHDHDEDHDDHDADDDADDHDGHADHVHDDN